MSALSRPNKSIIWDDGHDHTNQHVVVRRQDLDAILGSVDELMGEHTKLVVAASLVDAVESAINTAKAGHRQVSEDVLNNLVTIYRKALAS